jgi:hypothetical protein
VWGDGAHPVPQALLPLRHQPRRRPHAARPDQQEVRAARGQVHDDLDADRGPEFDLDTDLGLELDLDLCLEFDIDTDLVLECDLDPRSESDLDTDLDPQNLTLILTLTPRI